jgi:homoserine kinase type II
LPSLTTQLVHNDYRAANLLWHEGTLRAVLDFEELRPGHRVNDLAWAAVHLGTRFHNWGPVAPTVHATFGAGYASILPLSAAEQQWLPLLMRWHGLTLAAAASVRP